MNIKLVYEDKIPAGTVLWSGKQGVGIFNLKDVKEDWSNIIYGVEITYIVAGEYSKQFSKERLLTKQSLPYGNYDYGYIIRKDSSIIQSQSGPNYSTITKITAL